MINKYPKLGKYILDSLSIGMYNHPLMLLREYVQNSTDAIDQAIKSGELEKSESKIEISINGVNNSLSISDNGTGIFLDKAWNILHDIGKSEKKLSENRGFRGIGRLGGLGYCKILRFITKKRYENKYSISTWHCQRLRQLIKDENQLDIFQIIKEITDFKQADYHGSSRDHFFIVEMLDLQGSRDLLLNVPAIKSYLSEVAPVPFNRNKFSYADKIDKEIRAKVPQYETYKIIVNGEQIFKPYENAVLLRGDTRDRINDIDFVELKNSVNTLAFGWLANLKLLGSVSRTCLVDGIRIRNGNIQIGNNDLLCDFFREKRFNSYLVGELYTIDQRLIPNSRRDDFEDNEQREEFYDSFIRNIGLPYSKKIRLLSIERSKQRIINKENHIIEKANFILNHGYLSDLHRDKVVKELASLKNNNNGISEEYLNRIIATIHKSKHYLDQNSCRINRKEKERLRSLFEIIYKECKDKNEAEKIILKILKNGLKNIRSIKFSM